MSYWINVIQIFLRCVLRAAAWKMKNRAFRSLKIIEECGEIFITLLVIKQSETVSLKDTGNGSVSLFV